jgi:hypothetical protein
LGWITICGLASYGSGFPIAEVSMGEK